MEKLQILSANWMEGIGRSCRNGGSQAVVKTKMICDIKR